LPARLAGRRADAARARTTRGAGRYDRHAGAGGRPRHPRSQPRRDGGDGARGRPAAAAACQVAQVSRDRGDAGRARRRRRVLPEDRRGGGVGRRRHRRRACHQRSRRAREARAPRGARAACAGGCAVRRRARGAAAFGRGDGCGRDARRLCRSRRRRASLWRRAAIEAATRAAVASRDACVARGLRVDMITGAGTGTFEHEIASGVWTELQPGSYPFMDVDYARNVTADGAQRFRQSLFVLAGVMSTPAPTRAICDAGLKAFAFDSGLPQVADRDGVAYVKASDEHGVLDVPAGNAASLWGARIRLVPGHVDPTFNLYDFVVGYRGERVETVWPVARGTLG